jgi:hypothetical protein
MFDWEFGGRLNRSSVSYAFEQLEDCDAIKRASFTISLCSSTCEFFRPFVFLDRECKMQELLVTVPVTHVDS